LSGGDLGRREGYGKKKGGKERMQREPRLGGTSQCTPGSLKCEEGDWRRDGFAMAVVG